MPNDKKKGKKDEKKGEEEEKDDPFFGLSLAEKIALKFQMEKEKQRKKMMKSMANAAWEDRFGPDPNKKKEDPEDDKAKPSKKAKTS